VSFSPKLDRRLDLEDRVETPDGSGGFDVSWTKLGSLPAEVISRTGRERFIGGKGVSSLAYRITVRAAPEGAASRPKPDQRFRDGGRIYSILAVAESNKSDLYLYCWAEEGKGE